MYPLPTLLTLPLLLLTKLLVALMKRLKVLKKLQKIYLLVFFSSSFTGSVIASINTLECSNDFFILIILFISSSEINLVNPFLALTTPFPLIFFILFIVFEVKLLTNPEQLSLTKGIVTFGSVFFQNLLSKNRKIHRIDLY